MDRALTRRKAGVVASIAGAAALTVLTGSLASSVGATTARTAVPTLSSLEKQLTSLETPPSSNVTVTENGSSLFGPLFQEWQSGYPHSSVSIQPTISSSGTGISNAIAGTTLIGASDAYLPSSDTTVINIPVVASAQQINYNIPGLKQGTHLNLTASILNSIYTGSITNWSNSQIQKINKGVKIPSVPIITLHRSGASGDTFLFTSYLAAGDTSSFVTSQGGPSQQPQWPSVPGALSEGGNASMLSTCEATPGCVAYIGISYLNPAIAAGLGYANLMNGRGNFTGPTRININDEIASYQHIPANGTISLVDSTSKLAKYGYPIVNFEYAVVQPNQSNANAAQAIKAVLAWGMDPRYGASIPQFLGTVHFAPLQPNALAVAINLLKSIN